MDSGPLRGKYDFAPLETPRLRIRRFTEADAAPLQAYRSDPLVARYQSWDDFTLKDAARFVEEMQSLPCGMPGAGFQFAIELRETSSLIGDCYLKRDRQEPRQAEIGYTLSRAYQGRGYATEAVSCLLNYAFPAFDLHRVIALCDCENAASVALLERLGLRREGHFRQNLWFKGKWTDEYLYAILREEWQQRSPAEKGTQNGS